MIPSRRINVRTRPRPHLVIERVRRRVPNEACLGSTGQFWRYVSLPHLRFVARGIAAGDIAARNWRWPA